MKKKVLTVLCAMLLITACITQAAAARVKAESEEAFHGTWRMEAVYVDGIRVGFDRVYDISTCILLFRSQGS